MGSFLGFLDVRVDEAFNLNTSYFQEVWKGQVRSLALPFVSHILGATDKDIRGRENVLFIFDIVVSI
jgi:hypothetical protein